MSAAAVSHPARCWHGCGLRRRSCWRDAGRGATTPSTSPQRPHWVAPDGPSVSVATWYCLRTKACQVNMEENRLRLDYVRNDPRVTVTVLDADDWSRHVSIQRRVVQLQNDPNLTYIDRLCPALHRQPLRHP